MATERVTPRRDGATTERAVERRGSAFGDVIIGLAILALVAVIAVFLLNQRRNEGMRTDAVTSAASSIAFSAASAAKNFGTADPVK